VVDEVAQDMFRDILRIHTKARICFESDKPEASWGEEVVRPLLDLAISRTNGRAIVENVFVLRTPKPFTSFADII
jgi:hypothetical protein